MSPSSKDHIVKFLLMGTLFFLLSLSATLLRDISVFLSTPDSADVLIAAKRLNFHVPFFFFVMFLLLYRKDNLPRIVGVFPILVFMYVFLSLFFDLLAPFSGLTKLSFQLMGSVWPSLAAVSFWLLANQIYTLKEARVVYPLLSFIFPSLAIIASGQGIVWLSQTSEIGEMLRLFGFLLSGILALFVMTIWILQKKGYTAIPQTEPKKKVSMTFNMGYLGLILIMSTAFGLCNDLATIPLKRAIANAFPNAITYSQFMGEYSQYTGIVGFILFPVILLLVWRGGWFKSALTLPCVVILTIAGILLCCHYPQLGDSIPLIFGDKITPLTILLIAQNMLLKGLGILFMTVQNMAFIPLALAVKARGKMAISFLFGGSAAALAPFILMFFDAIPVDVHLEKFLLIILSIASIWLISVLALGKMFKRIAE